MPGIFPETQIKKELERKVFAMDFPKFKQVWPTQHSYLEKRDPERQNWQV